MTTTVDVRCQKVNVLSLMTPQQLQLLQSHFFAHGLSVFVKYIQLNDVHLQYSCEVRVTE